MSLLYAVRYFQVVSVVPRLYVAGFVISIAAAAVRLTSDPSAATDALTPVLLLQLFAASSGFHVPARRGHYDLLLTSGTPRWLIVLAHCLVSILPGLVGWLFVGMLELAASHGRHFASGAAGTCVAFIGMSMIAWATAVFASRATAAVGWLLLMTVPQVAQVVSPLRLLGVTHALARPSIAAISGIAVACVAVAVTRTVRGATPLEATQ